MERELFTVLMRALDSISATRQRPYKGTYTHRSVLAVAIWAAIHDRPISWATQTGNWPSHDRTRALPSSATMSRRLRSDAIVAIIDTLPGLLRLHGRGERTLIIDGRALTIARHSADPDAKFGRASGGLGRGYKLHAIVDSLGNCRDFRLEPLNISEQVVAHKMITRLEPGEADTLLGDKNYDSNKLYEIAGERGVQLIAPRRYEKAKGIGHHWHSEHRLRALGMLREDPGVMRGRRFIESCFGTQGNRIGGLGPLPNHVRRLGRVPLWVALKLAIDAAHRWIKTQPITQ